MEGIIAVNRANLGTLRYTLITNKNITNDTNLLDEQSHPFPDGGRIEGSKHLSRPLSHCLSPFHSVYGGGRGGQGETKRKSKLGMGGGGAKTHNPQYAAQV